MQRALARPQLRRPPWRRPWIRALFYQAAALALFGLLITFIVGNIRANLPRSGHSVGWDFLWFPTRFEIGDNLIGATAADPVWMSFLVGALNTVTVSITGIIVCSILGFTVAMARLSRNWLLSHIALVYVETVRNVPLLLQLLFWYGFSTLLPLPRAAWQPVPGVFVTNRGIFHPALETQPVHWLALAALVLAAVAALFLLRAGRRRRELTGARGPERMLALGLVVAAPALVLIAGGAGFQFEWPELQGFNFTGGGTVTPEFVAAVIALSVYMSGFTAETLRAGILGVHKGQIEAAKSLGLSAAQTLRLVTFPQALRIVIPPLTSQYLSLTKSSSLAVVIGYPELVRVSTAVSSETSRAIECITIIMAIYLSLSLATSAFMNWYNRRVALVEK